MAIADPSALPGVSIVTACRNAEQFIQETIESVLAQDYPKIEYYVVDGDSKDGTVSILQGYEGRLRYISEPDQGTADAINKGFRQTSGELFAFLNADDRYESSDAISTAVRRLIAEPDAGAVYGEGRWIDEDGNDLGRYPAAPFDPDRFRVECFICQPASLIRRSAIEAVGMLNPALRYTFDYDLWIRLAGRFRLVKIDQCLAASRMHRRSISLGSRKQVFRETIHLLQRHYSYVPFRWVHSYCSFLMDRRDQFFEPLRPGFSKYLASLPAGLRYNWRHPLRYLWEWSSVMSKEALERRIEERRARRTGES